MRTDPPRFLKLLSFFAALSLLAGCGEGDAPAGAGAPPPPKVTIASPTVESVSDYKEFSGRFAASDEVGIRARVSGYLTGADFTEGAIVQAGDPLLTIDPRPFEAALAKAQADVKVAQSRADYTKTTYERAETLFKSGDLSSQLRDQRLQERDQADAELARAKAAQDQAALDLSYTKIEAPITGRIGKKLATVGNFVTGGNTGAEVLATIVAIDPIYFTFDMDEQTYLALARTQDAPGNAATEAAISPRAGTADTPDTAPESPDSMDIAVAAESPAVLEPRTYPVSIALSDETGYPHQGVVDFLNNEIDAGTGTLEARATLPNPGGLLAPGMFGRVRITLGTPVKSVLIPESAIMIDQSRKFVYVVDDKNTASARTIETGALARDTLRVVTTGLTGDEKIVVNGLQRVRDGVTVTAETPGTDQPAEGAAQ